MVISGVVTRLGQQVSREREMGSYRLGELLGRGGMGEVYRATHRMLARPAAIKLIRPEVLDAGDGGTRAQVATVRFRREAEAAARLRSPHTVELYDFGVTEEGRLYLVMELLEGITLDMLVRQHGPVPPARVIHVLAPDLRLAGGGPRGGAGPPRHQAGQHSPGPGRPGARLREGARLRPGQVVRRSGGARSRSRAPWASRRAPRPTWPPRWRAATAVDGRADLYSLGCVAYYLLTGKLVFEAETAIQTILQHVQQPPVPPSQRTDMPIPPGLEALVLACLAKRPADRPASAAELRRALEAIGLEPWTEEQAARWWGTRETANDLIGLQR